MKPFTKKIWILATYLLLIVLFLENRVDAQECCYALRSDIITPGQEQFNISATSSAAADTPDFSYQALIQFPNDNMVPELTSPSTQTQCIKKPPSSFECSSRNSEIFFASFRVISAPKSDGTYNTATANVTLFGQQCKQSNFCRNLAAKTSGKDSISLGFLGTWPKPVAIIVGTIAGAIFLGGVYYVWRRHNPSDKYRDRSDVTDIITPPNMRNAPNEQLNPNTLLAKAGNRRSIPVQSSGKIPLSALSPKERKLSGLLNKVKSKPPQKRTKGSEETREVVVDMHDEVDEKTQLEELGSGLSGSRYLPISSVVVDVENDAVLELSKELEDKGLRGRSSEVKAIPATRSAKESTVINVTRRPSVKLHDQERDEKERHRERERDRDRDKERREDRREDRERERNRDRRDDRDKERHQDSKPTTKSSTTAGMRSSREKDQDNRESRSHHRSINQKERSRSRDPVNNERESRKIDRNASRVHRSGSKPREDPVNDERESRKTDRTASRAHRSVSKSRDETRSSSNRDSQPEVPLSRSKTIGSVEIRSSSSRKRSDDKRSREDLRRQAVRSSSASDLLIGEIGSTLASLGDLNRAKSTLVKSGDDDDDDNNDNDEKPKSNSTSRQNSRPTTQVLSTNPSRTPSKRQAKLKKMGVNSSDNESSSSENIPLADQLPLAMFASSASQKTPPHSPAYPSDSNKETGEYFEQTQSGSNPRSARTTPTRSLAPNTLTKEKLTAEMLEAKNGLEGDNSGYYESILDDVLNAGEFEDSSVSGGSDKVPVGGLLKTLSAEKKGRGKGNSASEDDEVPIGIRMGLSK
ncbi:hypothetical protein G9A89_006197 [Geosiphon pyriformis]|nr:hypothetical protein G9A89_006197 [Geosiphon pyriformis]